MIQKMGYLFCHKTNSMKKIIFLFDILSMLLLCSCTKTNPEVQNQSTSTVATVSHAATTKIDENCVIVSCDPQKETCDSALAEHKVGEALPGVYIISDASEVKCFYSDEARQAFIKDNGYSEMYKYVPDGVPDTDIVALTYCHDVTYDDGTVDKECEL